MEAQSKKDRSAVKKLKRLPVLESDREESQSEGERKKSSGEEEEDLLSDRGDEEVPPLPGRMRTEITSWLHWKWKNDLNGLKDVMDELGIVGMNYRSKRVSIKKFVEFAYNADWTVPENDGDGGSD